MEMMMRDERGYILFAALIFLQLFSLLSLIELQYAARDTKLTAQRWQRFNELMIAENALSQREKSLAFDADACQINKTIGDRLTEKKLAWWQNHACRDFIKNKIYYYVIEKIAHENCAVVNQQAPFTVAYYRVSLAFYDEPFKVMLQSTMAMKSAALPNCQNGPQKVILGELTRIEM